MKIEICEEIIQQTTKCTKHFDCLTNSEHIYCQVRGCIQHKVHYVACLLDQYCAYQISYGEAFICRCPTRKEIYNRYQK